MTDYTPTTEEVRRAVTSFNEYFDHPRAAEFDGDLFDRWLAEVKAQERKAERQRIIKNLLREREWLISTEDEDNERDAEGIFFALSLIAGEEQ